MPDPGPARAYESVVIEGVPHVRQRPDFCGEACVEMMTRKLGRPILQEEVFNRSGLDPALGRGVYAAELKEVVERLGFEPGAVWHSIDADKGPPGLAAQFDALYEDLRRGIPSIVCMHYSESPGTTEHFRLVLGYDAATDEVLYNEPAEDSGGYRRMKRAALLRMWPLKYSSSTWTVIRLRMQTPADFTAAPRPADEPRRAGYSPADYVQKVMAMKAKGGPDFTVLIEPPFVVAGDGTPKAVRRGADTVRWAVKMLKQDYFSEDPAEILEVWLFNGAESYRRNALKLFGDRPTTPYGYYSPQHKALIMDISTGGGTLVHEIVHPFIEANFADCPPWLNEGLGSLYEQSSEQGGHIRGLTNWRLAGLQKAIAAKKVPSFRELTAATPDAFYNEDKGTNYAQSRYLLYYLQEKGQLVRFYRELHAKRREDPTGYETLKRVLREEDMDAWKPRWESFVMELVFPE